MSNSTPCRVEGCPSNVTIAKGLCSTHYGRLRRGIPLDRPIRVMDGAQGCSVEDCDESHVARGLCSTHYHQWKRTKKPFPQPGPLKPRPFWAKGGNDVQYAAAHYRVRRAKGMANAHPCVDCGEQADEWSYNGSGIEERVSPEGLAYSLNTDQYEPRCKPCHRRFDAAHQSAQTV